MWQPSEATPENTAHSYSEVHQLSNIVPVQTSFHQKPWCELLKLSWPQNHRPTLDFLRNENTKSGHSDIPNVLNGRSLSPTNPDVSTFYQENGLMHFPLPRVINTGTDVVYSVSGHEPVRTRLRGETPNLSVFHLYQTEIIPDKELVEALTKDSHSVQLDDKNRASMCEVMLPYPMMKCSGGSDIFGSAFSTGSSSLSLRERQLQDDMEDCPGCNNNDVLSTSNVIYNRKLNDSSPNVERNGDGESSTIDNISMAAFTEKRDFISKPEEPTFAEKPDLDKPTAYEIPARQKDLADVKRIEGVGGKRLELDLDLTEGCTFHKAIQKLEETNGGNLSFLREPKLKRPPQFSLTFSKINTTHIQSEDRERVMKRLTKLPLRCKKNSLPLIKISESMKGDNKLQSCLSRRSQNLRKDTPLAKINLELDFIVEERKSILPLHLPRRPIIKYQTTTAVTCQEKMAEYCPDASCLHESVTSVSLNLTEGNVASIVLDGEGDFTNPQCEVTKSCDMVICCSSLPSSAGNDICQKKQVQTQNSDKNEPLLVTSNTLHARLRDESTSQNVIISSGSQQDQEIDFTGWNDDSTETTKGCVLLDSQDNTNVLLDLQDNTNVLLDLQDNTNVLLDLQDNTNVLLDLKDSTNVLLDLQDNTNVNQILLPGSPCEIITPESGSLIGLHRCSMINESPKTSSLQWLETDTLLSQDHSSQYGQSNQFHSRSSTSCSAASLDDVPYNSPAESYQGNNSPAESYQGNNSPVASDEAPIKSKNKCQIIQENVNNLSRVPSGDVHSEDNVPEPAVIHEQLRERSLARKKRSTLKNSVARCLCLDRNLPGPESLRNSSPFSVKHMKKKQTDVSVSSDELSQGSSISFSNNSVYSETAFPKLKLESDFENKIDTSIHLSESHTKFGQQRQAAVEHSVSQYNSDLPEHSERLDNFTNLFQDDNCTDILESYIGDDETKERKMKDLYPEKGCQVCKNVRFSDDNKVISFRIKGSTAPADNIPPVAFYTAEPKVSPIPTFRATMDRLQTPWNNQTLVTQAIQLHTWRRSGYGYSQMSRRCQVSNPFARFRRDENGLERPHLLKDIKWSAHSYTASQCSGNMCVQGRSLARKTDAERMTTSEMGVSCDSYHPFQSEESVMYTICQKCEEELHVKFGGTCQQDNGSTLQLDGKKRNATKIEEKIIKVEPTMLQNCGHRDEGYCPLCAKVMTWALSARTGELQA